MTNVSNNNMHVSKQRKLGIILSYVSIGLSILIQFLYTPFLISKLGQSEYGLYSIVSSIISYLTVLDLGLGNAIVVFSAKFRNLSDDKKEKTMLGMFKSVFLILAILVFIIGFMIYLNIDRIFSYSLNVEEISKLKIMTLILLFNLFITFSFNIYSSIINAYERFVFQKILSLLNVVLKPILMIPLLFMGYKSIALCVLITIINSFVMLSNYFYCKYKLKVKVKYMGFDKKIFFDILHYSFYIFLAVIVDKINWSVDHFILGSVSGKIAVSIYTVASQINTLFVSLSTAISGVLLPKISNMVAKKSTNNELTKEFIKVGRIQFYIVFFMISSLIIFGKQFFIAWVGEAFIDSYYVSLILIIPLFIPSIQNLGISIMQAKNMHKFRGILYLFIAICNVIISIPLAKANGAIGSALGTGIALILGNGIIINIYYYRKVGLDIIKFWKEIFKLLLPNILPIILIVLLININIFHGFTYLFVYGTIYTILYFTTIYFISMNSYERNIIKTIFNKLGGNI